MAALRTNIVDTGLGMSVFQLFMKQDEDRRVMHAASAVMCNIVTDFSPLRSVRADSFCSNTSVPFLTAFL